MPRTLIFLSHADKDKILAENIADKLKEKNFDVFVAHKDIETGFDWKQTIKNRIGECDLFLILLSSNFRKASYTDQEVGIAISNKKNIFPISIDNTEPYGFMSESQGSKFNIDKIDEEVRKLSEIFLRVVDGTFRTIDEIILELKYSSYFRNANKISDELFLYDDFTDGQIENIVKIYLCNYQVRKSWTAGPVIHNFLNEKCDLINSKFPKLAEQLKEYGVCLKH